MYNRIPTSLLLSFSDHNMFGMVFRLWQRKGKRFQTWQTWKFGFTCSLPQVTLVQKLHVISQNDSERFEETFGSLGVPKVTRLTQVDPNKTSMGPNSRTASTSLGG